MSSSRTAPWKRAPLKWVRSATAPLLSTTEWQPANRWSRPGNTACSLALASQRVAPPPRADRRHSSPARAKGTRNEHFERLHRAADCDLAADGRDSAGRCGGLPAPSGGAVAASRLSDDPGHDAAARCQPRDHGILGHPTAGAAVWADPGRYADDVEQRARQQRNHGPVRLVAQHRRCRAGYPDGDQCGERAAAEEPSLTADLPQGQSGGLADPRPCPYLGHGAADRG